MFPVALALIALADPLVLRALDHHLARHPTDADARVRRAVARELAGDRADALADWQAVAALRPADHRPHLHRARLLPPAEAAEAVDQAAALTWRLAAPTPMPQVVLPVSVVQRPTYPDDVLLAKADLLVAAADWGTALDLLADLAARRPADAATQLRFGRALLAWSRHDLAEAAFDAALRLDPTDPTALAGKATSRAAQGLPAADPLPPAARAYQKFHAGDPEAAVADALLALADEPGSFDLVALTSRLLLHADRPTAAVLVLSTAVDRPWPAVTRAGLVAARGMAWVRAGSLPAAERDADRAELLDPADPEPDFVRGQIAEAREDYRAAVGRYATLLIKHPAHEAATFRLAVLRASAPDPAVRDGEAAVALATKLPDGYPAFGLRAIGHAEAGRFAKAVSEVNAALAAGPPGDQRDQFLRMRAKFLADRPWRGDDDGD